MLFANYRLHQILSNKLSIGTSQKESFININSVTKINIWMLYNSIKETIKQLYFQGFSLCTV